MRNWIDLGELFSCIVIVAITAFPHAVSAQQELNPINICENADPQSQVITAERYVSAEIRELDVCTPQGCQRRDIWHPYRDLHARKHPEPELRYIYTYPPPDGLVRWTYEFTPGSDCTLYVTTVWAVGPPQRRPVEIYRELIPLSSAAPAPETTGSKTFIGLIGDHVTGGWTQFTGTTYRMAFKSGYINRLIFQTQGLYPIAHVQSVRLDPQMPWVEFTQKDTAPQDEGDGTRQPGRPAQ